MLLLEGGKGCKWEVDRVHTSQVDLVENEQIVFRIFEIRQMEIIKLTFKNNTIKLNRKHKHTQALVMENFWRVE